MLIGIDARFYGTPGKGLGRYASELIARLEELDTENEYVVFLRKENWKDYEPKNQRFRKALAEYRWYGWKEQLLYPLFLRGFKLDLMHVPHFNVPLLYRRPFVVTVHDLILLKHPTPRSTTLAPLLYRLKFLMYRLVIASALKRARAIITVSETARREIEAVFPFTKKKRMIVTYGACSSAFTPKAAGEAWSSDRVAELPKPFVLYVGSAYPHKNLERLLDAFRKFRENGHETYNLVLVGEDDHFYGRLRKESRAEGADRNVLFFGRADDAELAEIYRKAAFYVFPSLHEGFGLPPLEAMHNGLPVASSDASCMPEVLGDAACYFDANDTDSIAEALVRLADDDDLRRRLIDEGFRREKRYDWTTTARKTLGLYGHCFRQR